MSKEYAKVVWVAEDILTLKPDWTEERAAEFLDKIDRKLQDRTVEFGWGVIESFLDYEED